MDAARQKILDQVGQGLLSQAQADKMLVMLDGMPKIATTARPAAVPASTARDTVEAPLSVSPVLTLRNDAGDVHIGHTASAPRFRVEREATAADANEAQRRLESVGVSADDEGVRVAPGQEGTRATLWIELGEFDQIMVAGERVIVEGLSGDVSAEAASGCEVTRCGGTVDLRVENGDVASSGFSGRFAARVKNGSLHVLEASGFLEAVCMNGDATVEGFHGDVDFRVPNGEARVRLLHGTAKVRVGSGAVRLHDVEGSVDARAETGAIEAVLSPPPGCGVTLYTKQGDVMVRVPHDASLDIALRAHDGAAHFSPPAPEAVKDGGWTRLHMGAAEASLQVETGQGSVLLERVGGAPPPDVVISIDHVS